MALVRPTLSGSRGAAMTLHSSPATGDDSTRWLPFNRPAGVITDPSQSTYPAPSPVQRTGATSQLARRKLLVVQTQEDLAAPDRARHCLLDLVDGIDGGNRLTNAAGSDHVNELA